MILNFDKSFKVDEIEENLQYVGGTAGVVTLTAAVAATAYYYSTRPVPEKPLVPLDNQCPIEAVSSVIGPYLVLVMASSQQKHMIITGDVVTGCRACRMADEGSSCPMWRRHSVASSAKCANHK
uniref:Uncharacterized protein n=1 Tax=Anopheles culicifacies TaxID=139723 RepID=A0A182LTP6_9DIPT